MDASSTGGRSEANGVEIGTLVDRLTAVLRGHLKGHRRLLAAMEKKREACVRAEVPALEEAVAQERVAIEAIALTEAERSEATASLADAIGFAPAGRLRLLDLINLVGEEHREELLDLRDELRDVADEIDRLNRLSRTLVMHSLEHLHLFLILMKGEVPEAELFDEDGEEGSEPEHLLVNRRF